MAEFVVSNYALFESLPLEFPELIRKIFSWFHTFTRQKFNCLMPVLTKLRKVSVLYLRFFIFSDFLPPLIQTPKTRVSYYTSTLPVFFHWNITRYAN